MFASRYIRVGGRMGGGREGPSSKGRTGEIELLPPPRAPLSFFASEVFLPPLPLYPPLPLETGSHLATNPSSPLLLLSPFVCLSLSLPQSAPCQSERGSPSPSPSHLSFLLQGEGKGRGGGDRRSRGQKFNLVLLSSSSSSLPSSSCFPTIFFSLPEEIANKTRCYFTPSHLETYFRFELERGESTRGHKITAQ